MAWLLSLVLGWLMPRLIVGQARRETLSNLISGTTRLTVYLIALIMILALFFPGSSVLTALGLFSAGLGFAARPLFSDIIGGIALIFDDHFSVGEKVQLLDVTGYIEEVRLRNTYIRGDGGELLIVPNGEVRVIRNFSRSAFSLASVQVSVPREQVAICLAMLRKVAAQLYAERDDIVEEPLVLSESGLLSTKTLLTVKVKAEYGHGAKVRTHLITRVHKALGEQGIIAVTQPTPERPTVPINTAEIRASLRKKGDLQ
ncbi:MAG TPA: mechanosensitive ion channel domain-containing protein [Anaerolineae bacterium]|nr:mechanosensitive ion channel domain-containing protein [Anaerolineae bacterium]